MDRADEIKVREWLEDFLSPELIERAMAEVPEEIMLAGQRLRAARPDILGGSAGYDERMVGRDELDNGLCVSTVLTNDCGYETAVLDPERTHVVERYPNMEQAEDGHAKWIEFCKGNPTTVTIIGWFPGMPCEEVELQYGEGQDGH